MRALLRPGEGIDTVITADVYGEGEADRMLGSALKGRERDSFCLVGAIGHDFYTGQREGAKGFPRFTDPRLRGESEYGAYIRMATQRSLQRCGADRFDLLLLHNPDRRGYTSAAVWEGMRAVREAGLADELGVAPGPANGFTLDLIDCLERYSEQIAWAMIIFGPLEPWPGELVLEAARAHNVSLITRVVDYGGLLHGDLRDEGAFAAGDHRGFRPHGWVAAGRATIERMRPIAERRGLTMLQLACAWNLAQAPVACVAPTLVQESGPGARAIEAQRAELATVPALDALLEQEVAEIRRIGDNSGCMALKGASAEHEGEPQADRWALDEHLLALAQRWSIDPERDLGRRELSGAR